MVMRTNHPGEADAWLQAWEARLSRWAADGSTAPAAAQDQDPDPPFDRACAPRPLSLHLALAGALAGRAVLEAAGLAPDLVDSLASRGEYTGPGTPGMDPAAGAAVACAALDRISAMLDGIEAYRNHSWRRPGDEAPTLWQLGSSRLLDYAPDASGRPVVVVPSLVNRYWVLDLLPERSLLRWLAAQGLRPLLLDWGFPGASERLFGIGDYLAQRLEPALRTVSEDGPVDLVGYCMGGHFTIAAAQRNPGRCRRIALLATPWDFSAGEGAGAVLRDLARGLGDGTARSLLRQVGRCFGGFPVDFLQAIFAYLDPNLAVRKFAAFRDLSGDGPAARAFVATEDWLNDGLPLVPLAGEELLIDWCLENSTGRGAWRPGGRAILPERTVHPAMVIASRSDRIAPLSGVRPLADHIPGASWLEVDAGHVGMMTGSRSRHLMWEPLAAWLIAE